MKYARKKPSLVGSFAPSTVFLAEGNPEFCFIDKVLQNLDAPIDDCVVFLLGGYTELEGRMRVIFKEDNSQYITSLGIMLDADSRPDQRIRKAATVLRRWGFPSNEDRFKRGLSCENDAKRAAVFISPRAGQRGRIEDLVMDEIRTTDLFGCLSEYKNCVERQNLSLGEKGFVQAYISTNSGDVCGTGVAFQKGVLDINHVAYRDARDFVQSLL